MKSLVCHNKLWQRDVRTQMCGSRRLSGGGGMCHRGTMSEPLRISVLGGSSVNGTCLEAACPDAALNLAGRALALFQTPLLL